MKIWPWILALGATAAAIGLAATAGGESRPEPNAGLQTGRFLGQSGEWKIFPEGDGWRWEATIQNSRTLSAVYPTPDAAFDEIGLWAQRNGHGAPVRYS